MKKSIAIKKTLNPKDFRKTRGTILFSSRDPVFDDTEIGQYMGWKPHTVIQRRQEYDLRGFDDLKKKIQGIIPKTESFDTIKAERDMLEKKHAKEIKSLNLELQRLKNRFLKTDEEKREEFYKMIKETASKVVDEKMSRQKAIDELKSGLSGKI